MCFTAFTYALITWVGSGSTLRSHSGFTTLVLRMLTNVYGMVLLLPASWARQARASCRVCRGEGGTARSKHRGTNIKKHHHLSIGSINKQQFSPTGKLLLHVDPDPQHVKPLALGSAWKMRTQIREAKYHFKKLPHLYFNKKKLHRTVGIKVINPNNYFFVLNITGIQNKFFCWTK